jgi:hypothetical protein
MAKCQRPFNPWVHLFEDYICNLSNFVEAAIVEDSEDQLPQDRSTVTVFTSV